MCILMKNISKGNCSCFWPWSSGAHFISFFIIELHFRNRWPLSTTHPQDKHTFNYTYKEQWNTPVQSNNPWNKHIYKYLHSVTYNMYCYLDWGIPAFVCPVHKWRCSEQNCQEHLQHSGWRASDNVDVVNMTSATRRKSVRCKRYVISLVSASFMLFPITTETLCRKFDSERSFFNFGPVNNFNSRIIYSS